MKPKVFISHSTKDSEWVRQFAEALRKQDVTVWLADLEVKFGESLRGALETGLRESDAIVVLLSPTNARNPNVFFELGVALGTGKKLIPVVDEHLDPSSIPFDVRTRRYLIKRSPDETAQEVASAVKAA